MILRRRPVLIAAVLLVTVATVWVGAGSAGAAANRGEGSGTATTFVGRVKGLDASLGIVIQGDVAFAYLCDGAQLSQWFRGTVDDGKVDATSPSGAILAAELDKSRLVASVLVDGTLESFTLKKATGGAGLFRAEQIIDGDGFAAGWVVLSDGSVTGQVSAANLAGGRVLAAPPLVRLETTATTAPAAPAAKVVGTVAPVQVAATFPDVPPPDSEVEVVPFNAQEVTDESPGQDANGDTAPSGGPTTTIPETRADCKSLDKDIAGLQQTIVNLGSDFGETDRKARRETRIQVRTINRIIAGLEDFKDLLGCP